jgi:hypothetical protein
MPQAHLGTEPAMNEIIAIITQKTGISEAHARTAVDAVVGYLKTKLPLPIASQIEGLISGGAGGAASSLGDLAGDLGGLFGKK